MRFGTKDIIEEFFVQSVNADIIFNLVERTDYYLLYKIAHCPKAFGEQGGVYLADLAEEAEMSVTEASKAVHILDEKGYVMWHTDEKKERTYITLTGKARELMESQKQRMILCYKKIMSDLDPSEIQIMLSTLSKIRGIIREEHEAAV